MLVPQWPPEQMPWADATPVPAQGWCSSYSTRGRKLHPANTQTLCAQLSFGSLEHHWRSVACPDFVWVKTGFWQRGKWPRGARLWPRRRDHARTAGLWTYYPGVPGVNSLVATRVNQQQEAVFYSELPDLFCLGPCGTITPWRLEVTLFGRDLEEQSLEITFGPYACWFLIVFEPKKHATNTFLNWKRSLFSLRLKQF